ncbi:glycosyltransferase [Nocardia inohanensis]|uniref:glycosyltransferase n=1 Tax=Nocardia inohanensis TaxID=209246 RepID=UPI000834EFDE|nr:glycosyltransferase [Nocardia inohanensis]
MRVLLAFAGSRGDAQPGILLAQELTRRGHRVTLAVSPNLVALATSHGVQAEPFGLDSAELLRAQRDDARFTARNPLQRLRAILDLQRRGFAEAALDLLGIAGPADVLVTGMACEEAAAEVARHRGIPLAALHFFPIRPNGVVPVVPAGWGARLPKTANRLGWHLLTKARAAALAPEIAALRAAITPGFSGGWQLGRTPGAGSNAAYPRTVLHGYDVELFPGLIDEIGDGRVTGFPVPVPSADGIDPALTEWLAAGSAPVYAGFGSMPVADPAATARMVREVCARRGMRLLLAGGVFRGGIDGDVAVVEQVDHRAVLPRCAVAVHHGGAGTTAAALRAGVPSVICAVQADQPYWGRQVEKLGLGVALPFARLTGPRLEAALRRASEPETVLRAAAYGMRFRDDGVARAADVVESLVSAGNSPRLMEVRDDG